MAIQFIQGIPLFFGIIPAIPYCPPNYRIVLLFYKTIVILPVRACSCECDMSVFTKSVEMIINEF